MTRRRYTHHDVMRVLLRARQVVASGEAATIHAAFSSQGPFDDDRDDRNPGTLAEDAFVAAHGCLPSEYDEQQRTSGARIEALRLTIDLYARTHL